MSSYRGVPADADALVKLISAWGSLPKFKFHRAYPWFQGDRDEIIADFELSGATAELEATALLFSEYADEIYASGMSAFGQDPEGLEAKPASPTAESGDAQTQSSPSHE